jgi:hypothetical protein
MHRKKLPLNLYQNLGENGTRLQNTLFNNCTFISSRDAIEEGSVIQWIREITPE